MHIHRRLLGLAWPHLGPPEPIIVTKEWSPPVGQARVTCTPIAWVHVSKISPSGKREFCYFTFTLKWKRQTWEQIIPIVGQWWGGGTTEYWGMEGDYHGGLHHSAHVGAEPQGWLAGHLWLSCSNFLRTPVGRGYRYRKSEGCAL